MEWKDVPHTCDSQSWFGLEFRGNQATEVVAYFTDLGYEARRTKHGTHLVVGDAARGGILELCDLLPEAMVGCPDVEVRMVPKLH